MTETTPLNVSALAREHGVSRKTIRRRLAKGWRPPAPTEPMGPGAAETAAGRDLVSAAPTSLCAAVPTSLGVPMDDAPTPGRPGHLEVLPPVAHSSSSGAAILIAVALAIGALALAINGQTGWRFGTTTFAAITFASLSVAGDARNHAADGGSCVMACPPKGTGAGRVDRRRRRSRGRCAGIARLR
jgi:hypothetical protein